MELRTYQIEAVEAAWKAIKSGEDPLIVAPTGSGKSLMIAALCAENFRRKAERHIYSSGRAIVVAHRKELLQQNAAKLASLLPELGVGLYSAGLRSREVQTPVIVGGIQSIWNRAHELGDRDLVLIDEAHLVSPREGTRYQHFLRSLAEFCPRLRIAGFTATPFRTSEGLLTEGNNPMFSVVAHEIEVAPLLEAGYLCSLVSRIPSTVDMSGVAIRRGEYVAGQAEERWLDEDLCEVHAREMIARTTGRRKILVFCSGVAHAERFASILRDLAGEPVGIICGKTPSADREQLIRDFRDASLKWLVNVDVLTVGFDAPSIDAICVLRATCSPGLFAQICGRGFRTADNKQDCLILDWGGNIRRHGALDHPSYGRDQSGSARDLVECDACGAIVSPIKEVCGSRIEGSEEKCEGLILPWTCKNPKCETKNLRSAQVCSQCETDRNARVCPQCEAINKPDSTCCSSCGFVWVVEPRKINLEKEVETKASILFASSAKEFVRRAEVVSVALKRHSGRQGKADTLKIQYEIQELGDKSGSPLPRFVYEWLCPEHSGYARTKFGSFWRLHSGSEIPQTISEAIAIWQAGGLRMPIRVVVSHDGSFWTIDRREFEEEIPSAIVATQTMIECASKGGDPWDDLPF